MSLFVTFLLLFVINLESTSCLRFHSFYGDGMVLQHDVPVQVWGYEDLLNDVEGSLQCVSRRNGQRSYESVRVTSQADGVWSMELPARSSDNICTIEVSGGGEVISLSDVLFGDVWICSGQSNMEQNMGNIINSTEEIAASAKYDKIRYMVVANTASENLDDDVDIKVQVPWSDSASQNLRSMSAVCYLFARNIQNMLESEGADLLPLGMVDSDWGGTRIEAWSSQEALDTCDVPQESCNEDAAQSCHSGLWNSMMNPLKRNAVKGFLWYQGEANEGYNRDLYNCTFPAMIESWRHEFSQNSATSKTAPFGFVQLASWRPDSLAAGVPVIRWHQTADVGVVPNDIMENVFMSSPLDTYDSKEGYPGGIHPRYKQIVAERLAVAGMNVAYQYQAPYAPYGPVPSTSVFDQLKMTHVIYYDVPFTYTNTEISGFYACTNNAEECDVGGQVNTWVEIEKENVSALDDHTISINLESYRGESALSLAYLWRETPVKEYLGLPIYGLEPFHLPSPPWKKTLPINYK